MFLLALFSFAALQEVIHCYYVGTWNIENFGPEKATNETIFGRITQVIGNFDVLAIQGISDVTNSSILKLQNALRGYSILVSPRLGAGSEAEQFAVIHSTNKFSVKAEGIFEGAQAFLWAPYFVSFKSFNSSLTVGFGVVHTNPRQARDELDRLAGVADWFTAKTSIQNLLLVGDFNAACDRVTQRDFANMTLAARSEFRWLVPSCLDTTVSETTSCAYDRVVLKGDELWRKYVPESFETFDFRKRYRITQELAEKISGHFPVRTEIED